MGKNDINVLMLRHNKVDPDPRVEKEVNSLLVCSNINIEVLAWDRTDNYNYRKDTLNLENGMAVIHRIGIVAGWGVGMKKNAVAFIKYVVKTFSWLMKHHKHYDVIHACDLQTVIPALIPIVLYKKKLVYDIYDYYSDTAHGSELILTLSRLFETKVINKASATIICSEQREKQIEPATPKKLCVIHNAPSKKQLVTESNSICQSQTNKPKLVYVGNLVEDRCIREIVELAKLQPDVEFHIGGMGALTSLVEESSKNLKNLFFYGKMKYADVLALEKECDILIAFYDQAVRNHRYAAPNKFYEAIGLGKPLVMLHDTGVDEIIDKYDLGVTVDQNIENMVKGINCLINRKDEWLQIASRAKELFIKQYCWEIMEERLLGLYSDIVKEMRI